MDDFNFSEQHLLVQQRLANKGVSNFLVRIFDQSDELTAESYNGMGTDITDQIPIVFGKVLIRGQVVDGAVMRSDLDPAKVDKVIRFVAGEAPSKGIAGVDDKKLENVIINGNRVQNPSTGVQNQKVGLKEVAGALAGAAIAMEGASLVRGMLGIDPKTGTTIPDTVAGVIVNEPVKPTLNDIDDFNTTTAQDKDVLVYDAETYKWKNQSFVTVFQNSGIGLTGDSGGSGGGTPLTVKYAGSVVSSNVTTINLLGTAVSSVTDAGSNQVNVTLSDTTGSGGGGSGGSGGGGGTSPSSCKVILTLPKTPTPGQIYYLKRNGYTITSYTVVSGDTKFDIATTLANTSGITEINYSVSPPDSRDTTFAVVTVAGGWEPCLGCSNVGTWTITTSDGGSSSSISSVCSPITPMFI